jgi:hypothetical protein
MVLSRETAWTALSLTFPFDHFFFFADLPPLDAAGAAFALAYGTEKPGELPVAEKAYPKLKRRIHRLFEHILPESIADHRRDFHRTILDEIMLTIVVVTVDEETSSGRWTRKDERVPCLAFIR